MKFIKVINNLHVGFHFRMVGSLLSEARFVPANYPKINVKKYTKK